MSTDDHENKVRLLLKESGMDEYWEKFVDNGYDDLNQLLEMSKSELEETLCSDINMTKKGHRKRFIAKISILNASPDVPNETEGSVQPTKERSKRKQISCYTVFCYFILVLLNCLLFINKPCPKVFVLEN